MNLNILLLCFLLVEWNLLSHPDMVVNAHIDLFGFSNDALLCFVGPSKTDQEGVKHADHPCLENPAICILTAFTWFMIAYPEVLKDDMKIFDVYRSMNALTISSMMLFALHSTNNSFSTMELLLSTLALTHSGREL